MLPIRRNSCNCSVTIAKDHELNKTRICPHPNPLPQEREQESGSLSPWGEGLGEGFAPLREEDERLKRSPNIVRFYLIHDP